MTISFIDDIITDTLTIMLIYLDKMPFWVGKFKQIVNDLFVSLAKRKTARIIFPTTLHELALSKNNQSEPFYRQVDVSTCDSMILTYFLRYKTKKIIDRVYGPELILAILDKNKQLYCKYPSLFLAADEVTMHKMAKLIGKRYPKMLAKFVFLPKNITHQQEVAYLEKINFSGPGFVWIGIGSPKQIELANWFKKKYLRVDIYCVGAAFDFLTKQKKQAPVWMQRSGLEWFFRLITEPKRLWRRYLFIIPKYLLSRLFKIAGKSS